jgi:type IV secretory pathway TraG/TraD family ATPase VirD4
MRQSTSEQYVGAPLVPAQDILSLKFGRQIVMVQNSLHMPVLARSAFYDKVRALRVRSKKRAPQLRSA